MSDILTIVKNFDGPISWAPTYCGTGLRAGLAVVDAPDLGSSADFLFIGDRLPDRRNEHLGKWLYFLAAADCTSTEYASIATADHTTTVSTTDKKRIVRNSKLPISDQVSVDGFPIDFEVLDDIRSKTGTVDTNAVCFLGRTDSDKGPNLEIEIAKQLINQQYDVFHMSNGVLSIKDRLERLGVKVIENISGLNYLSRLATMGCVINTSPRESLFVAGLEATRLGIPVLAPSLEDSGIHDWNFEERMYNLDNPDSVMPLARDLTSNRLHVDLPDISSYCSKAYFERLESYCGKT